jgi:hypothetical protein
MDIEERVYQSEFWGADPEFPPNHQFGGLQWEAVQEKVILEEDSYPRPQFYEELEIGFGQSSLM